MIARGGRLGGAAHGDTAATYAAFNPSRRPRRRDVFETEPCLSQDPLASSSRLELGCQVSRRFYRVFLFTAEDSFSGDVWIGALLARICVTSLPREQVRRSCEHAQAQRASRDAVCAAFRTRCAFFNGESPIGQLPLTKSDEWPVLVYESNSRWAAADSWIVCTDDMLRFYALRDRADLAFLTSFHTINQPLYQQVRVI